MPEPSPECGFRDTRAQHTEKKWSSKQQRSCTTRRSKACCFVAKRTRDTYYVLAGFGDRTETARDIHRSSPIIRALWYRRTFSLKTFAIKMTGALVYVETDESVRALSQTGRCIFKYDFTRGLFSTVNFSKITHSLATRNLNAWEEQIYFPREIDNER